MPFLSHYEVGGIELAIEQRPEETPDGSKLNANSGTVWDAGIVLMQYLTTERGGKLAGTKGVELGCGTGVVGIAAAALGMDTVLTDYEEVCVLAEKNIALNEGNVAGKLMAAPLEWTTATAESLAVPAYQGVDYILCSDLVCAGLYASTGLVNLLRLLLDANPTAACLMSHELRSGDQMQQFVDAVRACGMRACVTSKDRVPPAYRCDEIEVLLVELGDSPAPHDAPPAA